jgi:hypothetical protein
MRTAAKTPWKANQSAKPGVNYNRPSVDEVSIGKPLQGILADFSLSVHQAHDFFWF